MAWILTRKRNNEFQRYVDEDIYGLGKWKSPDECENWWNGLPVLFDAREFAQNRAYVEETKDPSWDYKVSFYDR